MILIERSFFFGFRNFITVPHRSKEDNQVMRVEDFKRPISLYVGWNYGRNILRVRISQKIPYSLSF